MYREAQSSNLHVRKLFAIQEMLRSPLGVLLFVSTNKSTCLGFCVIYRLIRMTKAVGQKLNQVAVVRGDTDGHEIDWKYETL